MRERVELRPGTEAAEPTVRYCGSLAAIVLVP